MSVEKKAKPDIVIKGKDCYLSIWLGDNVRITVTKKTQNGFERIDSFMMPLEYLLFKVLEKKRDVLKKFAVFVESVEEEVPEE